MKVGHIIGGLKVTDVKRVNKLNLIQFLKEVDSYLQKGYKLDVQSGRQVGLVLQADMFKTEAVSNIDVGSTDVSSTGEGSVSELFVVDNDSVETIEEVVAEVTEQPKENVAVEPVEEAPVTEEIAPLTAKKTTTRSKKTAQ